MVAPKQQDTADQESSMAKCTNYDKATSERYSDIKIQSWRSRVELFSVMQVIGDVHGKNVLDMGCGDGWLTRAIKKAGASKVRGSDFSESMVALAKQKEEEDKLGISFYTEDARSPAPLNGSDGYDLVTGNWLLVYARNRTELGEFCMGLAQKVRPGGRMVTVVTNPDLYRSHDNPAQYGKYGWSLRLPDLPVREGSRITLVGKVAEGTTVEIENYYFPKDVYVAELEKAGFKDVKVHSLAVQPKAVDGEEEDNFFNEIAFEWPIGIIFEGVRDTK